MSRPDTSATRLTVAELPARKPYRFDIRPDAEALTALIEDLELLALRKLRFHGMLEPEGRDAWRLSAELGATAVQPCVVTLEPVTTRIDTPVSRLFLRDYALPEVEGEVEMPEDDSTEPLGKEIDLMAVIRESLALALPDYPRADGAELKNADFAAPGVTPMTDADAKPFASLADLKAKLDNRDDET
ncbi:DUF177 domain-containing protein [Roseovarius faecimaris]|uniref:DUF177 domain-containing protein n=1 Tax=Roseovarius faecimaris TaxID=2494550 RepID=A0A6I6IRV7_9RHOB|nr:DUF177 domain-containing protein [Roseovarius faecimaris]QGX98623.1 DUF177 domain-containing protein [Roseovarius faecimaris]